MRYLTVVLSAAYLASAPIADAQVLAPPAPNGQDFLINDLISSIENKDVAKYSNLLADDVKVYEGERLIADNKTSWMTQFGEPLAAAGVTYTIKSAYPSSGSLLTIEYFNSAGSWGNGPPSHCCWHYDAVSYTFVGGKIGEIHRLSGGQEDIISKR